jgi:hypothetical protein
MTSEGEHLCRVAKMPGGYTVTFSCRVIGKAALDQKFEWEPDIPQFSRSSRKWREFRDAYNVARREFFTEVANRINGAVLVVDLDGRMETITPTEKTKPAPIFKTWPDIEKLAVNVVKWATDLQVIVGPVRWNDRDGKAEKKWYFTIETAWPGPDRYQSIMVEAGAEEREQIAECRTQLLFELTKHRPLVVHSLADEIGEVRLMEALWPCERATKLRKVVEEEHKSWEQGLG